MIHYATLDQIAQDRIAARHRVADRHRLLATGRRVRSWRRTSPASSATHTT